VHDPREGEGSFGLVLCGFGNNTKEAIIKRTFLLLFFCFAFSILSPIAAEAEKWTGVPDRNREIDVVYIKVVHLNNNNWRWIARVRNSTDHDLVNDIRDRIVIAGQQTKCSINNAFKCNLHSCGDHIVELGRGEYKSYMQPWTKRSDAKTFVFRIRYDNRLGSYSYKNCLISLDDPMPACSPRARAFGPQKVKLIGMKFRNSDDPKYNRRVTIRFQNLTAKTQKVVFEMMHRGGNGDWLGVRGQRYHTVVLQPKQMLNVTKYAYLVPGTREFRVQTNKEKRGNISVQNTLLLMCRSDCVIMAC